MVTMLIQMLMSSRSIGLLLAVVIISGSACGRFDVLTPAVIGFASEEANKVSEELINPPPEELGAVSVIVERAGYNSEPHYSPDLDALVFVSEEGGSRDIWRIARDGSGLTQLTAFSGEETAPGLEFYGEYHCIHFRFTQQPGNLDDDKYRIESAGGYVRFRQ